MGISVVLYRVKQAEHISDLSNITAQMDRSKSVNLYKVTQDLGLIFMNSTDPYADEIELPYKMLFGNYVDIQAGDKLINGFVPTSEVAAICNWIFVKKLLRFQGFAKIYNQLNNESINELVSIGADDIGYLYANYVFPLTQFYFDALHEKQSVVICGE